METIATTSRRDRFTVGVIGAAAVALAAGGAVLTTGEQAFTWSEIAVAFLIGATVVAVTSLALLPWAERTHRLSLWSVGLGSVALITTLLFWWTGAPIALGSAAVVLGRHSRSATLSNHRTATAGVVLGSTAAAVNVGVLVVSIVAQFSPALPQ